MTDKTVDRVLEIRREMEKIKLEIADLNSGIHRIDRRFLFRTESRARYFFRILRRRVGYKEETIDIPLSENDINALINIRTDQLFALEDELSKL